MTMQTDNAFVRTPFHRPVLWWLGLCIACVVAMVLVGGLTRLTNSGLSMVEWRPVTGWLPPLTDDAWQSEIAKYRTSPEYQKINKGMSITEFQQIYYWEYGHRLLGRITGLIVGLPLLFFWWRRALSRRFSLKLLGIFALGGLQGAVGWLMVKSGLIDRPSVSHYRLAMHLAVAFTLFSLLWWQWLNVKIESAPRRVAALKNMRPQILWVLGILVIQILWGAFVAGLDAGLVYNTYPLMDGAFFPAGGLMQTPVWVNFLEHIPAVQWFHRWWAMVVVAMVALLWWRTRQVAALQPLPQLLVMAVVLQVVLGISTLLWVVPVMLASLHQLMALCLLAIVIALLHRSSRGFYVR